MAPVTNADFFLPFSCLKDGKSGEVPEWREVRDERGACSFDAMGQLLSRQQAPGMAFYQTNQK